MAAPAERSPLVRARGYWEQIKACKLHYLLNLVRRLYEQNVRFEDVPLTRDELSATMIQYGQQAQTEAADGEFKALKRISYMVRAQHPGITWESFGLSEARARELVANQARGLYRDVEADPALALTILNLPCLDDWDALIGEGAESAIAAAAIKWFQGSYARLFDLETPRSDARSLAQTLCDLVGDWREMEQWAADQGSTVPTDRLYTGLGLTYEQCLERLTFWE